MRYIIIYSTSLPGSTCNIVFTLSRNTLALFSSPFGALTLKTFVAGAELDPATAPCGGTLRSSLGAEDFLLVSMSMISGFLDGSFRTGGLAKGSATI